MKRFLRLLAMIQILSQASIASGESAWVLWSNTGSFRVGAGLGTNNWEVLNAYQDRQSCLKGAVSYITFLEDYNKTQEGVRMRKQEYAGRTKLFIESNEGSTSFSGVCLPESVDPRPRAKE
jgi:hypothetical protein